MLDAEETRRYARHLVLKDIGGAGQQKLKAAKVIVIGAGGLGSPVIAYLAAAGIGTLGIVDHDLITLSNLQRQIIHGTHDVGLAKTESAAGYVEAVNPYVEMVLHKTRLTATNAAELIAGYDVILDGTDDFETRRAVAAAAEAQAIPVVSGAVSMWDGQLTVFAHGKRFTDLYPVTRSPEDLPTCEAVGVMGPIVGVIGTLMAMEAIKLITGTGDPLIGRLMLYDGRSARFTEVAF